MRKVSDGDGGRNGKQRSRRGLLRADVRVVPRERRRQRLGNGAGVWRGLRSLQR
jgi:hypothetical protein